MAKFPRYRLEHRPFGAIIFSSLLLGNMLHALEFGGMGNVSMGMGGAGVALKNSQWGIYYNPALLGVSKKNHFAYSFGASIREKNLLRATKIDIKNLQALPNAVGGLFSDSKNKKSLQDSLIGNESSYFLNSFTMINSRENVNIEGYFGDVLSNLVNSGESGEVTDEQLKDYLDGVISSATGNSQKSGSLDDAVKKVQELAKDPSNQDKLFNQVQQDLINASKEAGGNAIFDNIIENLSPDSIGGVADLIQNASKGDGVSIDEVLKQLGGITLSLSQDANLNRAIQDINTIQEVLRSNNFSVSSQNGLAIQIASNEHIGGFGMGIFANVFAAASASFDEKHNRIIVESGNNYIELGIQNDSVSVSSSDKNSFESSSIFSSKANHRLSASGLFITEVPVGYGQSFDIGFGEISLGVSLKYLFGMGYGIEKSGGFEQFKSLKVTGSPVFSHNFGIDVGMLYSLGGFSLGVVGKNLNNPGLKVSENKTVYLNPQVRAGMAYNWGILNLAFDADLLPNHTLSASFPKSQMIGGGMMLDFKVFDIRAGAMYDIYGFTNSGLILTAGVNLFGFLDIAVQSSLKLTEINNKLKIPDYLSLKIGGGFSW